MRPRRRQLLALGFLGSLSLGLPGCGGGGGGTTPTPVTQPAAPVRTVVSQGTGTLQAPLSTGEYYFGLVPFSTTAAGTIDVRVDWTFPTNTVWVFLTQSSCTVEQFQHVDCPGGPGCPCQMALSSMVSTPKPRTLSLPNAAAGNRSLIVSNLGPREESVTYEVGLTR